MARRSKKKNRRYTSARDVAKRQKAGKDRPSLSIPRDVPLFRLEKAGKVKIDILPFVAGKGNPYADKGYLHYERMFWEHRGVGADEKSYACLVENFGKRCPICEARRDLEKSSDEDDNELAKSLRPKRRQLFNVIDLNDRDTGVQVWEYSYYNFGELLNDLVSDADEDEDNKGFWLAEEGMTLRLTVKEKKLPGYSFMEVTHIDFRKRKKQYDEEELLECTYSLDDFVVEHDYDELEEIFRQGRVSGDDSDEDDEDDSESKPRGKPKGKPKKKRGRKREEDEDIDDDEDEDEEDEDDDEEDEGDDEDVDDDDEDDDDEDEDGDEEDEDDDEEEEPKPRRRKSSKSEPKKKGKEGKPKKKSTGWESEDYEDEDDVPF